ncbi:MAG: redoxin domain-containing protein [Opitutaceae bacterium]
MSRRFTSLVVATAVLASGLAPAAQAQSLKERLDARRAEFLKTAPADRAQSYQAGIDAVSGSGIYDRALKTGAKAPDFTLNNAEGRPTRLSELLKKGPVVLTWYRGGWCPYCNIALAALAGKIRFFTERSGYTVTTDAEADRACRRRNH